MCVFKHNCEKGSVCEYLFCFTAKLANTQFLVEQLQFYWVCRVFSPFSFSWRSSIGINYHSLRKQIWKTHTATAGGVGQFFWFQLIKSVLELQWRVLKCLRETLRFNRQQSCLFPFIVSVSCSFSHLIAASDIRNFYLHYKFFWMGTKAVYMLGGEAAAQYFC